LALSPAPALADVADSKGALAAYLRARVASERNEPTRAATDYAASLAASPDPAVAIRAWREAVTAGDAALADTSLAILDRAGASPEDAALFAAAEGARDKDPDRLDAAIARLAKTRLVLLAPVLRAWALRARKSDPYPALDAPEGDGTARRLATETRALLLIADGREKEGLAVVRSLGLETGVDLRLAAAQALIAKGERDPARSLFNGEESALGDALAREKKRRLAPGFGVSRLFSRVASDLLGGESNPLAVSFTRAALIADPSNERARILLATALARAGAVEPALATLAAVRADGPLGSAATCTRVAVLKAADREAEALDDARRLAERDGASRYDWQTYADLLSELGRPADALPWYRRVADGEGAAEWAAWMQLGGALETSGDWPGALAALRKAVELAPEEPLALNYLGYARVTRGEAPAESRALLERAYKLAPDNTSIADSLGWAYHLTGDTARALPLLEVAASGEPGNAEIGEHLGDVYWALGRRYEARYAWSAATLVAPEKDKARLSEKVARGL
jgi:tetratricopeptide (TPR) repeat protein